MHKAGDLGVKTGDLPLIFSEKTQKESRPKRLRGHTANDFSPKKAAFATYFTRTR